MKASSELRLRNINGNDLIQGSIYVLGIALTLYTIYYAWELPFDRGRHSNIFLGVGFSLFYLTQLSALRGNKGANTAYTPSVGDQSSRIADLKSKLGMGAIDSKISAVVCVIFAVSALLLAAYMEIHWNRFMFDAHVEGYTQTDMLVGVGILLIVIDSTRRAFGNMISGVIIASILYAMLGPIFPGVFSHGGMDPHQIIRYAVLDLSGVYGFILGVGSTWVAIFIMFAGIAKVYGLMDLILDFGDELKKVLRSGVVHIAIIASMIMGSITGSAAANTATTGSFTIPLMKQQGVHDDFAAAIEGVASSGGQIMPPVMGVAAFLMADILAIVYVDIIVAGVLPAVLFYFSIALSTQYLVYKHGWTSEASGTLDRSLFWQGIHFIVPLAVMLYTLMILRWTPMSAGMYTIFSIIGTMYVRNVMTDGVSSVTETTKTSLKGFKQGAIDMAPLISILAGLGVIVSLITQTGLSQKISFRMISLGGGVLIVVLLLAMITSILFGLGMPTPAAYILVVILAAPPLVELGVPELSAHFFVFYFAMLSAITPPVALAVAVGARIADANFLQSCIQALRIAAIPFMLPFIFVFNDSLLFWEFPTTVIILVSIAVGIVATIYTTVGHDGVGSVSYPLRAGYAILALLAFFGPTWVLPIPVVGVIALKVASSGITIPRYTTIGR
jgi:TRAP transporter 4TM/12TM fusion protein